MFRRSHIDVFLGVHKEVGDCSGGVRHGTGWRQPPLCNHWASPGCTNAIHTHCGIRGQPPGAFRSAELRHMWGVYGSQVPFENQALGGRGGVSHGKGWRKPHLCHHLVCHRCTKSNQPHCSLGGEPPGAFLVRAEERYLAPVDPPHVSHPGLV